MALSDEVGIPRTCHLGKYLGHHLLHCGRNRDAHVYLVERAKKRLEGWKLRCVSRAGRLTLAQSVLGSISIFHMQMEKLPTWVHKDLDRAMRRCVWGKNDGSREIHILEWEELTKPNRLGGASIKIGQRMNWALLTKLAWRVLTSNGELWCDMLKAKYGAHEDDGGHFRPKHSSS